MSEDFKKPIPNYNKCNKHLLLFPSKLLLLFQSFQISWSCSLSLSSSRFKLVRLSTRHHLAACVALSVSVAVEQGAAGRADAEHLVHGAQNLMDGDHGGRGDGGRGGSQEGKGGVYL